MKKWIINRVFLLLIIVASAMQMTGCGTIIRGDSFKGTYRGFDMDKKYASDDFALVYTFGIAPAICVLSMPIDIAVDTVLFPFDFVINFLQEKSYPQSSNTLPVFAVNMTNTPDFNYTIQKQTGEVLAKGTTSKTLQMGSKAPTINMVWRLTPDGDWSRLRVDAVEIKWQASQSTPLSTHSSGAATFVETRTPTDDLRRSGSIIMLFMPCNTVVVINSERTFYNADFINQKAIQDRYKQLTKMAEKSQCKPELLEHRSAIEHAWDKPRSRD